MVKRRKLCCSFCGKKETEVAKLVAGPRAYICGPRLYICDGCVALASRIMESDVDDDSRPLRAELSVWRKVVARAWQLLRGVGRRRIARYVCSPRDILADRSVP